MLLDEVDRGADDPVLVGRRVFGVEDGDVGEELLEGFADPRAGVLEGRVVVEAEVGMHGDIHAEEVKDDVRLVDRGRLLLGMCRCLSPSPAGKGA